MVNKFRGYVNWAFRAFKPLEHKIILAGDTESGKSTLLYQWKENKFTQQHPRIMTGFEVETFDYPPKCFWSVWNVTLGSDIAKPLLKHFIHNTEAVLYVHNCDPRLDGCDDRTPNLHLWVGLMLENGCRFLYIVPNKQDLLTPEKAGDLAQYLAKIYGEELARYQNQISWRILYHRISAKTGEGVWEILDQLYYELPSDTGSDQEHSRQGVQTEAISNPNPLPMKKAKTGDSQSILDEESDRLLQFAFLVMQHKQISASVSEDSDIIPQALSILQSTTIRQRAMDIDIPPYSKTRACFWIHIVRACLESLCHSNPDGICPRDLDFADFKALFALSRTLWMKYYSQNAWYSIPARMEFAAPDQNPLPDVIEIPSAQQKLLGKKSKKDTVGEQSLEDILVPVLTGRKGVDTDLPCCAGDPACDARILSVEKQ
ncbi:P-loop containing nucleoside triphosphate hydrolase protein [Aspergillus lucknowensis]|uniref:P-loop containing nucleoside triphosphate hydrolase protein n=1 Tax=Aspergillus lucknowensis TaxID=176173 RepID=A0ABR4M4C9_9EURO